MFFILYSVFSPLYILHSLYSLFSILFIFHSVFLFFIPYSFFLIPHSLLWFAPGPIQKFYKHFFWLFGFPPIYILAYFDYWNYVMKRGLFCNLYRYFLLQEKSTLTYWKILFWSQGFSASCMFCPVQHCSWPFDLQPLF